jgi:hypothetical protein
LADQRVPRLSSTVLAGTLPSFVLAVTPEAPGVSSTTGGGGSGVFVGNGVGVDVGAVVGVGVAVGTLTPAKTLISVTLFIVGLVGSLLPWPR